MTDSTTDKWQAVRVLGERFGAPHALLARAAGVSERTLQQRRSREGWRDPKPFAALIDQSRRLTEKMAEELEAIAAHPQKGFDKARLDALMSAIRAAEKMNELVSSDETVKELHAQRDADVARLLDAIDRRIVELARSYAERLVGAGAGPAHGVAGA